MVSLFNRRQRLVDDSEAFARLAQLAYEQSLKRLEHQRTTIDELRVRTGHLIAVAALVASFLGARTLERAGFAVAPVVGLVAFGVLVCAAVAILFPRRGLVLGLRGSKSFELLYGHRKRLGEPERRLAYWIDGYYDKNQKVVRSLQRRYRLAALGLLVEVVAFATGLAIA